MRKILPFLSLLLLGLALAAQPMMGSGGMMGPGLSSQGLLDLVPGIADKKPSELTLADRARIADALSVKLQGEHFVRHAAVSSFILPGSGQFQVGKPLEGSFFLLAQAAFVGGAMAGSYYLMPADFKAAWGDRTAMHDLMFSGRFTEALPAMGVMAGGMALAFVNMSLSSRLAYRDARELVTSGKISFTPRLVGGMSGMGLGFGLGF